MSHDLSFKAKSVSIEANDAWQVSIEAQDVDLDELLDNFSTDDVLSELKKDDIFEYLGEDELVDRLEGLGYTVTKE